MQLVEVIAGLRVLRARRWRSPAPPARRWASRVIDAADGPGFLVNRCNRPFGLEALRLLQERIADVETIDAHRAAPAAASGWGRSSCRTSSGSTSASRSRKSFYELSFGEPRWRPSPLSAQMVAAGRLRPQDRPRLVHLRGRPAPAGRPDAAGAGRPGDGDGPVVISGFLPIADELRALADERRLRRRRRRPTATCRG